MSGNYVFTIVGKNDNPLYDIEFSSSSKREDTAHLNQFILHSALDIVSEHVFATNQPFLKVIDKFNDQMISAFVTPGHIKFLLLHDVRNEDGIRSFFSEVYEIYLRILLNPFYEPNSPITSPVFNTRVRALGRKYF